VCAALFLLGLDYTVLNVALPSLQHDLGPSMTQTQWIVDGYALTLGGCVLAAGALGDTYGRRRAFLAGQTVCLLASAVGAVGRTTTQLVAARCGMGLGAALFMPATLSTIVHVFADPKQRRKAIAIWAAVAGIGALAGPVLGGWLVEQYSWRAAFWLNVPVAAALTAAAVLLVPESRNPRPDRLDLRGVLLSCGGLLSLVWGIIEAPGRGWTSSPVLTAFSVAVVLLAAFLRWETRCGAPLVPVKLFRQGPVGPASLSLALMSFAMFGAMFLLTLYLQEVRGLSAWAAGIRTIPLSLGLALGAATSPLLAGRFGARLPVSIGLLLIATGFVLLGQLRPDSTDGPVLTFQALSGFGAGLVAPAATETVMNAVPTTAAGIGSALNDATRQVGSTLGVAVLGSVLSTVATSRLGTPLGPRVPTPISSTAIGHGADQAAVAFTDGLAAAASVGCAAALLGAAAAWITLSPVSPADQPAPVRGGRTATVGQGPQPRPSAMSSSADPTTWSIPMDSPPARTPLRVLLVRQFAHLLMKNPSDSWTVPSPDGRYRQGEGDPLRLVLLGDSLAQGLGALTPQDTPGAHLAEGLAETTGRPVDLQVLARVGATTKTMQRQVSKAVCRPPGFALIVVGANDAMLPVPIGRAARRFGRALDSLGDAGWRLIVVPCPDPGRAPGLRAPIRLLASPRARRLARLQTRAALRAGAVMAPSSVDLFVEHAEDLLGPDGLHPSPRGYAEQSARILSSLLVAVRAGGPHNAGGLEAAAM
jgi:EmrB/QacA subfamily drug resistance transporter